MAYVFYKFRICFFLSVLSKTKHTAHMCSGLKALKHNVRTTLRLAYHGCKNLKHTSKTRQAKRTQMVATARFTIRVLLLFRLLRMERNEAFVIVRKAVRFKPESSPDNIQ